MTPNEAIAWADKTMNDRLREARRTGTDHDYDQFMEDCIDALAAEVRALRTALVSWQQIAGERAEMIAALRQRHAEAVAVVAEQAEDDGLWFVAQYASEAYLQAALRRLHAAVEGGGA